LPLHILIISDNASFAAYLSELLVDAGHDASSIAEGKEAFRAIRRQKPDLVIIAVEGSKVAGLAIEHRLHSSAGTRIVPVIVISECLRLEAELLHVFDFIPKPLDVKRLFDDLAALGRRPEKGCSDQEMSDELCSDVSKHILSCTGLHFEPRNRASLARGLDKRMSALHLNSYPEYFAYLKLHGEDRHELQKLLQFLTVGETYFFRYPGHFEALGERFSEKIPPATQPIRIWSAGCSTGEEPYSIAITLMEALPDWRNRDIRIFATDINNRSLKQARDGVYSPWAMRTTPPSHLKRYFDRVGESFLIKDEVKQLVEFHHLNLSTPCNERVCSELKGLDAIFCRNVLIYFAPETVESMLQSFAEALGISGQLFLGHAETLLPRNFDLEIHRREKSFYYSKTRVKQRAGAAAPPQLPQARRAAAAAPPQPQPQPQPAPARIACPVAAPSPAAAGIEAARHLFDQEDFDGALALLELLLKASPDQTEALVLRGFILAGKGSFQEALDTCTRVLGLNDLLPEAYFLRGVLLDASDRLAEAADEYRKALLLDHDFIMPRYHMGRLHLRLGRGAEAAREIRNSIRILAKRGDDGTVPYSGGLTRAVCMLQLQNALAQVA